ncbi:MULTISPECIES: Lrp/AsnC family transcriptional regulator [unclassified Rhizobium]|uniref:Lrp/AsnC family transcriptional regulator n=1 Tax=unclassified Rhizobium TaxID=2613769 RepID=UPI0002719861|nr:MULTISPECIES: Lrp/AsnC family transcriptional regulator [unclassified Rhizobium]EJL50684.1 transcriptional regulator [Rhizobium sp. CF122]MBB3393562.1 DNA-binding Lrp family transcriptional regulator [Rhizobium sp. BK060]MBB4166279.1 DNA-binding Lrp family transcriptional regulator [Rhizobium sp. BK538]TCM81832.1 AsnC family transcriptional regulator [Rhizobium sp. BK068]
MTMSDKDRQLLSILSENARMPTAVLARRLGLSRTTVQAKIERLERDGVIAGYGVRLSDDFEGGQIKAHVLITLAAKALGRVTQELQSIAHVRSVHSVSGSFDMIAIVAAASISELDMVIDKIGDIDGVEKTLSSIILSTRINR